MGRSSNNNNNRQTYKPPEMGTIAASALPSLSGLPEVAGTTEKPTPKPTYGAPISYFKNQSEIPAGVTGYVRPNANAVGVNRVTGTAPPQQQQGGDLDRKALAMAIMRASFPMSVKGGSVGQRYRGTQGSR